MGFAVFCILSILMIISSVLVVSFHNPVYAVLSLILTFVVSSGIFVLLSAEFIAMLIVLVYVGAVAVLFLFIVMMINVDYLRFQRSSFKYFIAAFIGAMIFFSSLSFIISKSHINFTNLNNESTILEGFSNIEQIGNLIYTKYMYIFHLSGILLLIAIMGALVITLNSSSHRKIRRQNVMEQVRRSSNVRLVNIKVGEGIDESFN